MATAESLRSLSSIPARLATLQRTIDDLRTRVAELEGSLAAIDAVRDDVRRLTEQVTEELNRLSAASDE